MPLWQAIVLAVVQGLTEFLPISSTAHLALLPWLFRFKDPGLTFDVALHLGTLAAVLLYFYRTWVDLLLAGFGIRKPAGASENSDSYDKSKTALKPARNPALLWLLVVATIPAAVAGWLLQEQVATSWRHPVVMGFALIAVALLMAWGENVSQGKKEVASVSFSDSLWIGCSQALALVPGVSRSGITMTAALLRDFNRAAAARFSFLLSTPIIAGAALKSCLDLYHQGVPADMLWPLLAGVAASGIVGYATISFLLKFLQFGTFKIFIYYRIILGIIVLALAFFLRLEAVN
jgi:undecaprenyl-diphosphatase